jgi:hypothetical protein
MTNYDKLQAALAEEFAVLVTSDNGSRGRRQPAVPEQTDAHPCASVALVQCIQHKTIAA